MTQDAGSMKDAEARIRALTREVGALREELRRELKRRERAVGQVCWAICGSAPGTQRDTTQQFCVKIARY